MMKKIMYVFLILLLLSACSNESARVVYPDAAPDELEQELKQHKAVKGYKSVSDENDIVVAIEIKRLSRFNKEKIEKKITKQLNKTYPDKKVLVTSDLKVKWEVEKIIKEKKEEKKLTKSIEKIKSLSKEET